MHTKETVNKENLFEVLDLLDNLHMAYWIDGGWGVDILFGQQTREHRDVDIDFDSRFTGALLDMLNRAGYEIVTDWRPCRIELYHQRWGYIDIHPLVLAADGSARQALPDGNGWYRFEADYFTHTRFEGRTIPCLSVQAQKLFHSGYELRERDKLDLETLSQIGANTARGL